MKTKEQLKEIFVENINTDNKKEKLLGEFVNIVTTNINRDGIENLLNYLIYDSDFTTAPASTRYHGCYECGLLQHSLDVFYAIKDELSFIYGKRWSEKYSVETASIVSLFHDMCKIDRYKKSLKNVKNIDTGKWETKEVYVYNENTLEMGHGSKSVIMLSQYIKLTEEEIQAIYWHMGAYDLGNYNTVSHLSDTFQKNTLAFALHRADMLATYITDNKYFEPISYNS